MKVRIYLFVLFALHVNLCRIINLTFWIYFSTNYFVTEYVDFWFDTIHCHQTYEQPVTGPPSHSIIDPPVILVFTGKDKYEKVIVLYLIVYLLNDNEHLFDQSVCVLDNDRRFFRQAFYLPLSCLFIMFIFIKMTEVNLIGNKNNFTQ